VLSILIILITQFAWSAKVERTIAHNSKDDLKMFFAARGTIAFVRAQLRADRVKSPKFDSLREDWADPSLNSLTIGDVQLTLDLEDCDRFLNVNLLNDPQTKAFAHDTLMNLAKRLQIDNPEEIVERITDYVDADSDGQYEAGARNLPLFHADELLDMPGLTPDHMLALLGIHPPVGSDVQPRKGLLEFLTASGSKKLNINTCPTDLFASLPFEQYGIANPDRDSIASALDSYRTGQDSGTGSSTGSSTGTSTKASTASSTGGSTGDPNAKPGNDFETIDQIKKVSGLEQLQLPALAPGPGQPAAPAQPAQPSATPPGGQAPKISLRRVLDVSALDWRILVDANRSGLATRYEIVLRRGVDEFDTLMWREVPRLGQALPGQPPGMGGGMTMGAMR
jgi:hypothetical protein